MNVLELDDLARIAHAVWSEHMRSQGWRPGAQFDAISQTHDALVPFVRLHRRDRLAIRRAMESLDFESQVLGAIVLSRGANREFLIEEMTVGREVVFCSRQESPRTDAGCRDIGSIEGWDSDEEGELDVIRVRWPDGRLIEYLPSLLELARAEELEQ